MCELQYAKIRVMKTCGNLGWVFRVITPFGQSKDIPYNNVRKVQQPFFNACKGW